MPRYAAALRVAAADAPCRDAFALHAAYASAARYELRHTLR